MAYFRPRPPVNAQEPLETGFSTKTEGRQAIRRQRLINKDGTFNVLRDDRFASVEHIYYYVLRLSWLNFHLVILGIYVLINLGFAVLYFLIGIEAILPGASQLPRIEQFYECFNFSVQTFTTVGYGTLEPEGLLMNAVANTESLMGLIAISIFSGFLYARFTSASALIRFSDKMVIVPHGDSRQVKFRLVNQRPNRLTELRAHLFLSIHKMIGEQYKTDFYELPLEVNSIDFFPLNWTVVHTIDKKSPLTDLTRDDLNAKQVEFLVMIHAFDDTFSDRVMAQTSYIPAEIEWDADFVPMYSLRDDGMTELKVDLLDELQAIDRQ